MSFQSLAFLGFLAVTLAVCLTSGAAQPPSGRGPADRRLRRYSTFWAPADGRWCWAGVACLLAGICVTALGHPPDGPVRRPPPDTGSGLRLSHRRAGGLQVHGVPHRRRGGGGLGAPGAELFHLPAAVAAEGGLYRGIRPRRRGIRLLLYGLFFPTVTSGPILRPGTFFPQLRGEGFLHPDWSDAAAGVYAICCGTIKKVLLADAFGTVVNNGWAHLEELSAPAAWLVILGYTLQLYFDFSGYCDIAAGVARLFGLRLPVNFDSPYRSASVTEFWKRWHITLTTFLRECLYFPLGGSRRGTVRTYCNILIVFLVSGFWHGAGLDLPGVGRPPRPGPGGWSGPGAGAGTGCPVLLRWGLTFLFVNIAWVFFRAPDCAGALELLGRAVTGGLAKPEAWLLEGLFAEETGAVQMLLPALHALEEHPAGGAAVWGGDGRRPLAPERASAGWRTSGPRSGGARP